MKTTKFYSLLLLIYKLFSSPSHHFTYALVVSHISKEQILYAEALSDAMSHAYQNS